MDGTHYSQIGLEFEAREQARRDEFSPVWQETLESVFADVAPYYDIASDFASLGMCSRWRRIFTTSIDVGPGDKVLDVCAGTNGVGISPGRAGNSPFRKSRKDWPSASMYLPSRKTKYIGTSSA